MIKKVISLCFALSIKLCAVIFALYITSWSNQFFTPTEMRSYNLALQYAGMVTAFMSIGIPQFLQKQYTTKMNHEFQGVVWSTMLFTQILLLLIGFGLYLILYIFQNDIDLLIFVGVYFIQFFAILDINFRSICDALGRTWQFNLIDLIIRLSLSGSLFLYSQYSNSWYMYGFLVITFGFYLGQFFIDWFWQREFTTLRQPDFKIFQQNKTFFYFTILTIVVTVFSANTERIFIDFFKYSDAILNGYINAYRILEFGFLVQIVTIPAMVSYALKNKISQKALPANIPEFSRWLVLALVQSILLFTALYIIAPFGLSVIDPLNRYRSESLDVVYILLWILIPSGVGGFLSSVLIVLGRSKREFLSLCMFTIVSIFLYIFLIPSFGHVGAAWASLIGSVILTITKIILFLHLFMHRIKIHST